jgi:hypothetical protein
LTFKYVDDYCGVHIYLPTITCFVQKATTICRHAQTFLWIFQNADCYTPKIPKVYPKCKNRLFHPYITSKLKILTVLRDHQDIHWIINIASSYMHVTLQVPQVNARNGTKNATHQTRSFPLVLRLPLEPPALGAGGTLVPCALTYEDAEVVVVLNVERAGEYVALAGAEVEDGADGVRVAEEATRLSEDKTLESSEARDRALDRGEEVDDVCVTVGFDADGVEMLWERTKLGTWEGAVVGADVGTFDCCGGVIPGVNDGRTPGV